MRASKTAGTRALLSGCPNCTCSSAAEVAKSSDGDEDADADADADAIRRARDG